MHSFESHQDEMLSIIFCQFCIKLKENWDQNWKEYLGNIFQLQPYWISAWRERTFFTIALISSEKSKKIVVHFCRFEVKVGHRKDVLAKAKNIVIWQKIAPLFATFSQQNTQNFLSHLELLFSAILTNGSGKNYMGIDFGFEKFHPALHRGWWGGFISLIWECEYVCSSSLDR